MGPGRPCREERKIAGTGADLSLERDADIHDVRALHLGSVERYDTRGPDTGGRYVDSDDRHGAFVRQGDEGCKRLPHRARGPGPEHRVNDEIGLIEDAEEGFDVCGAPDRVEGDRAVPKKRCLDGSLRGHLTRVRVDDVDRVEVLEVAGCHHSIAAVVSLPAEDEDAGGVVGEDSIHERPPGALHHPERREPQQSSVLFDCPHSAGADHAGLKELPHPFHRYTALPEHCLIGAMRSLHRYLLNGAVRYVGAGLPVCLTPQRASFPSAMIY